MYDGSTPRPFAAAVAAPLRLLCLLLLLATTAAALTAPPFAAVDQCDPRWGGLPTGAAANRSTLCDSGSMLASIFIAARLQTPSGITLEQVNVGTSFNCSGRAGVGCAAVDVGQWAGRFLSNQDTVVSAGGGNISCLALASLVSDQRVGVAAYVPRLRGYVTITGLGGGPGSPGGRRGQSVAAAAGGHGGAGVIAAMVRSRIGYKARPMPARPRADVQQVERPREGTEGGADLATTFATINPKGAFVEDVVYGDFDPASFVPMTVQQYPLFKQCNASWGGNVMGRNNDTICQVGCLMTSISMALAANGVPVGNQSATPATVCTFLRTHGGFWENTSALIESVIATIDPAHVKYNSSTDNHRTNDIPYAAVTAMLVRRSPVAAIANVLHGEHFVLVTGTSADGDTLFVNDPGFATLSYSYHNDVVGWRLFQIT